MKAAVIRMVNGHKALDVEDTTKPECAPNEVVVEVKYSGICGSDLHGFLDDNGTSRAPGLIMGHESAGEIAEIGTEVTKFEPGDRVTIDPQVTCGACEACRRGWISICHNKKVIGSSLRGFVQGAMAEYAAVAEKQVLPLPDTVSLTEAAVIEPLSNAIHVVNRANIGIGNLVVVLGAGPLGLCILQAAKVAGADTVIVTDTSEPRLNVAANLGADVTINPAKHSLREEVMRLSRNQGADVVIESVGIDATYQDAIDVVKKRGNVMFFGAVQKMVTVDLMSILHKEINIIGCTGANDETTSAIQMVSDKRIDIESLITHQFELDEAQAAFETLQDPSTKAIKVLLVP